MKKLTIADLRDACSSPRCDHPGRKAQAESGAENLELMLHGGGAQRAAVPEAAPKPKRKWEWYYGDRRGVVQTVSRVDARSAIKRVLNIPMKHRLPICIFIRPRP